MTKRTVNTPLLRKWVQNNGDRALERLALDSGCSASLVQKLCSGNYESSLSIKKIDGLCRVTGYKIDELFPVLENKKESA
jgi:transcriptional regulator with XRE-family HTH domain